MYWNRKSDEKGNEADGKQKGAKGKQVRVFCEDGRKKAPGRAKKPLNERESAI